jgi:hypothetical protein
MTNSLAGYHIRYGTVAYTAQEQPNTGTATHAVHNYKLKAVLTTRLATVIRTGV